MPRSSRSNDWGFPRWRSYGKSREAVELRSCDREGCSEPGAHPAPKAPNSPERWHFCQAHAAEYNRNWDYFQGLSPEEAARRAAQEQAEAREYRASAQWQWGGPGDGTRPRAELDALAVLELDSDADFQAVKAAYRRLAKAYHPDANPGNAEAAERFQALQTAYDLLRRAENKPQGKA